MRTLLSIVSIVLLASFAPHSVMVQLESKPALEDVRSEEITEGVQFTLHNSSAKSIPLIIPGVMNPNLSPFSNSGVYLNFGQEIFFKVRGKRHLLLTVDSTIEQESKLDVARLIKKRKKELGIR